MKRFKEFIITEALKPVETEYGWIEDGKFISELVDEYPKLVRTLFSYQDNYYVVFFEIKEKTELGFFKVSDLNALSLGMFSSSYTKANSDKISIGIFNRVMFVALKLMEMYDVKEFSYHAPEQNLELDRFYNNIYSNKQFILAMKSLGLKIEVGKIMVGKNSVTEFTTKKG